MTMLNVHRQRQQDVADILAELVQVAQDVGAKTLAEKVEKDLIKKLHEDRFHLVVVGEFNHGKSSFVNALLGTSALPVGVTPTTATIHHIKHSEEPTATVVHTDGTREPIAFGDARTFAVGGGRSPDDIDHLEIGYPAPLLAERILLVDTPGVNDLSHQRADITYSYIPRADAVLFLLDAGQILKESERVFLQEKLLAASRDKIVFVITKWDILSEEERKEAFDYAKEQLGKLVKAPVLFPVSAETALAGRRFESGMPELVAHLEAFLAEERGRILLDNAIGGGLSHETMLRKGLDARRRAVTMKSEELDRRIALLERDLAGQTGTLEQRRLELREAIGGIKAGARKDLDRFVDDLVGKLPAVIDGAKREDLGQYLPAFLEDTFKRWAEAEAKEIAEKLEDLAERTIALVKDDAHDAGKRVAEVLGADQQRLDVHVDTFKYDIGIAALLAIGFGALFTNLLLAGVLLAAAPVLAFVLKDKVDAEYKKRAKELAPQVVRDVAARVAPKLDEMIDQFAQKLESWVVTTSEELQREVFEVLSASKAARADGAIDEGAAKATLDAQATRLTDVRTRLEGLRSGLWGAEVPAAAAPAPAANDERVRVL